ncbi:uncharacterized protein BP5553_09145 [Venustampulla echinocandica]|uniref:Heterokaryon incompatibility domain-containing protein n=1 Tax=Venustampulla echinocandica TaxID=2656787 RepID=A0A370TE10_9HELO|nr:uncharacterized protein BP5553_09145 [Venustampulla echinocandica]RDL32689.1 hypothetical protein BP5553_09145 [Venustampulla echinocandica]
MNLYETLPTPHSIRVLTLKRPTLGIEGIEKDTERSATGVEQPVYCEMSVISLTEPEPFDALSYVWGDPSVRERSMVCNDKMVPITSNLWTALHQIWGEWPDKKLWVDAICINQTDIPERNQQVTMMGGIYNIAQCVVVWLGEATQKSEDFFKILEKVRDGQDLSLTYGKNFNELLDFGGEILSRAWFRRAWTLQEISLSTDSIVCCGSQYADFRIFLKTIYSLNRLSEAEHFCGARILDVPTLAQVGEDRTLFHLLAQTQERESSDPRDKVYCLLSLLPRDLYDFMEADYSLSVEETFTWAARVCIELDKDLHCLWAAGLEALERARQERRFQRRRQERLQGPLQREDSDEEGLESEEEDRREDEDIFLPSWVPNWKTEDEVSSLRNLYRLIESARTDPERLRSRSNHGWRLERKSRKIGIPGFGFGRLKIDKQEDSALLTVFPKCAMRTLEFQPSKTSTSMELSNNDFVTLCKRINRHDIEHCACIDGSPRVRYPLCHLPTRVKEGDWLWTPTFGNNKRDDKDDYEDRIYIDNGDVWDDDDDGNDGIDGMMEMSRMMNGDKKDIFYVFVLRPVEATEEAQFQLVGKGVGKAYNLKRQWARILTTFILI